LLEKACEFITSCGEKRHQILFSGNKLEAHGDVKAAGEKLDLPYSKERWLGGTLTNWAELKKRVARLEDLTQKRERGELGMYTKKERVLIDREIDHLERFFGGLRTMKRLPNVLFVVDPREENTAVAEARTLSIPIVAIAGTDCDVSLVDYPIVCNDASRATISYILDIIVAAYEEGVRKAPEGAAGITTPAGTETLADKDKTAKVTGAEFGI